ncbi:MAG: hypothetical protein ACLUKN_02260 [Bacilli bacterium]
MGFLPIGNFFQQRCKHGNFPDIYVKLPHSPSLNADLNFIPYQIGIQNAKNCKIQNIAVRDSAGTANNRLVNSTVENVDIDAIGGSVQIGYKRWVRLGNGIEFWSPTGLRAIIRR